LTSPVTRERCLATERRRDSQVSKPRVTRVRHVQREGSALAIRHIADLRGSGRPRLLTTLTNHEFLIRAVDSRPQIRKVYSDLEGLLTNDAHYWLQRGSYELERGDIVLAENFLSQARGMVSGDHMVDTEFAYLLMEKACRDPKNVRANDWFQEALGIIYDAIDVHPAASANTYGVLAMHAAEWASCSATTKEEQAALLQSVRGVMAKAVRYYPGNPQFEKARDDLETAYLSLAVDR